jgi:hypothetical protein
LKFKNKKILLVLHQINKNKKNNFQRFKKAYLIILDKIYNNKTNIKILKFKTILPKNILKIINNKQLVKKVREIS